MAPAGGDRYSPVLQAAGVPSYRRDLDARPPKSWQLQQLHVGNFVAVVPRVVGSRHRLMPPRLSLHAGSAQHPGGVRAWDTNRPLAALESTHKARVCRHVARALSFSLGVGEHWGRHAPLSVSVAWVFQILDAAKFLKGGYGPWPTGLEPF